MPEDALTDYRRKRRAARTPEPVPPPAKDIRSGRVGPPEQPRFVIQEHHASSLHWDFRLERDEVLASWALPKGLPVTPERNHLAVQVEDHPLEYGSFSGTIPAGEYGAGTVSIWDEGTYECEKWRPREVMVVLHGGRTEGRFVLFPTQGKKWMIHRMDAPPDGFEPLPDQLAPMLAVAGDLPGGEGWAFEFKWDGIRVLLWIDGGRPRAVSRGGHDLTAAFPELRGLAEAMGSDQVLLDGELVVLGDGGRPSFARLQHRMHAGSPEEGKRASLADPASLIVFDLLHRNGRSLLDLPYDDRRAQLEQLGIAGAGWGVTPSFTEERGEDVLRSAVELGMEGVVAKRRDGAYHPGARSREWIKVKSQRMQEVVIGGWTEGQGERRQTFGALLLGIPVPGGRGRLDYVGKVGTGFTEAARRQLLDDLGPGRTTSPFVDALPTAVTRDAHWVRPTTVGEVRFSEWTPAGHLRHPVWRGVRSDKSAKEVRRES
ncbi:MAG TPA: non-homologous end-joining DNA ligase [Acidimicrobiales bacterium]|nr:non-homologous end-joining DNA ligase [Acidimicrobiales bacterium]